MVVAPSGMLVTTEEYVTLTADGLTLIAPATDTTGFLASTRSKLGAVDFGPPSASGFGNLTVTAPRNLWAPVISADGLAFYYVVHGDPSAGVNGIYESVRASTSAPFPPGQRMPDLVQQWAQNVNAVSVDRMAIFLEEPGTAYETAVLTRSSLTEPFTNPNAPNAPPVVAGFRTRPLASCTRLVGTCTPGGCLNEDVCSYSAQ
jgi:hypothetical protein